MKNAYCLPDVAVVLPTFNEEGRVKQVLDYYGFLENVIYVIDNNSNDATVSIVQGCHGVKLYSKSNPGTTECEEWFFWLVNTISADYYLFLSCSERLSCPYFNRLRSLIDDRCDLYYTDRISYTGNYESIVFNGYKSIFSPNAMRPSVCRFIKRDVLVANYKNILIHDNFKSFAPHYRQIVDKDPDCAVIHLRPYPDLSELKKLVDYASVESRSLSGSYMRHAAKNILRELFIAAKLFAMGRLKFPDNIDLVSRIAMHLNVYVLAVTSRQVGRQRL